METLLRRLRGALLNGVLWAGAWSVASVGISAVLRSFGLAPGSFVEALPSVVIGGAFVGFVSGMGFSFVLAAAFRRRRVRGIGYGAFALTGAAVAGVLVPSIFYLPMMMSGFTVAALELGLNAALAAGLGGATSLAMLKLARSAPEAIGDGGGEGELGATTLVGASER